MTPEEMFCTLAKVKELYEFTKKQTPRFWWSVSRRNGKTLMLYRFIREYRAVLVAYERAEKKAEAKLRRSKAARLFAQKIRGLFRRRSALRETKCKDGYTAGAVYFDELNSSKAYCIHCARCGKLLRVTYNPPSESASVPLENIEYFCQNCHIKEHEKGVTDK